MASTDPVSLTTLLIEEDIVSENLSTWADELQNGTYHPADTQGRAAQPSLTP